MEELLSFNIRINLIKIDNVWNDLNNISKNINNKSASHLYNEKKSIFEMISFIQTILNQLIFILKNNNIIKLKNIVYVVEKNIDDIEKRFESLKKEIKKYNSKIDIHEDVNIILSYIESVTKNGYINFDEYKNQYNI